VIAPWHRWRRTTSLLLVPPSLALIAIANSVGGFPFFSYGIFFVVVFVWIGVCHRPLFSILFAPLAAIAYVLPVLIIGKDVAAGLSSAASVIPVCILVGESLSWVASRYAKGRQEIRESQEQYAALVELSPDPIFVHSDHRFVFANPAGLRLVGAEHADQLIGRSILDVVHPDYWKIVLGRVRTELEHGQAVPLIEERFIRLDGSEIDVEVAGAAITYEGRPAGLVVVRDITDRKLAEEAAKQSVEALRRSDRERRRLLAHLVTAQEDERQRLAADIHDDTIQLMTAAAMRLDLARRKFAPSQQPMLDSAAETVHRSIERLRHLIFELRPAVLDRDGLAEAVAAYLAGTTQPESELESHLENRLERDLPEDVRIVAYRIVQEALSNGRKHARATTVHVLLESSDEGIRVEVRDDGVGFLADVVQESPPGHLGLTAMRERAEMAGGWLSIISAPGEGTVVQYWLPTVPGVFDSTDSGVVAS